MPDANGAARICVGLLSGTSADGIDAAVVRIAREGESVSLQLLDFQTTPYPEPVRAELFALFEQPQRSVERLCTLDVVLGELFAGAARVACERAGIPMRDIFVIGSHGQTVWHQPQSDPALPLSVPSTLQIGDAAVIAERCGRPVVSDFRKADMSAGGQGAPLTPYLDWAVLRHPGLRRAVQNIGGIGNVTFLPAGGKLEDVIAFDTGPGNVLIDGIVSLLSEGRQRFDQDGRLALEGEVDGALLERLMAEHFLSLPPPKTTGRELFGLPRCRDLLAESGLEPGILSRHPSPQERAHACRLVATVTAFTAQSIAGAYRRFLPPLDEVIVGGGGSRNPALMATLRGLLAPAPVVTHERYGIDGKAKEALLFALLAHDARLGLPTNVPAATGARRAVVLGSLNPPR